MVLSVFVIFGIILLLYIGKETFLKTYENKMGRGPENSSSNIDPSKKIKVRFGNVNSSSAALANIADKKGFFRQEGLEMQITTYEVGKQAIDDMLAGKEDFAVSAQTPVILAGFERTDFKVIAFLATNNDTFKIVGRKDKGINNKLDLKNKKINVTKGSALVYFLDMLLDKNGLEKKDVIITEHDISKASELLESGQIDAVAAYDVSAVNILRKLGDNGILFSEPSLYTTFIPLTVSNDFLNKNQGAVQGVLKALIKASEYIYTNKSDAKHIIADYSKIDAGELDSLMSNVDFGLSLKQGLIYSMNTEAKWMISSGKTTKKDIPDYMDIIEEGPLKKLLPQNVTVIR